MPELQVQRGPTGLAREILEASAVGEMRVLGKEGDTRVTWNARDEAEVSAARSQFNQLRGQGFLAYSVEEGSGGRGEQVHEFDANAQKMIMVPPMAGGSQLAEQDAEATVRANATDAECLRAALDWANILRGEYGIPPLEELPCGWRGEGSSCVMSQALSGLPDGTPIAAGPGGRVLPLGAKPGLRFGREGRTIHIDLPPLVEEFIRRFDVGHYPDLAEPPLRPGVTVSPL